MESSDPVHTYPMITALVFAIISLGLVGLVTVDCQAHLRNADDENPPQDRVRRD